MLSIDIPATQHKIYMGGRFIYGTQILVQNLEVESSHSKTGVKRYLFEVGAPSTRPSAARLQEDAVKLGLDPLTYYFKAEVNHGFSCLMLKNYLPPAPFHMQFQNSHYGVVTATFLPKTCYWPLFKQGTEKG